jgi:hypothetical protein
MRPATADTLPTELTSSDLSIDPAATTVRNDLGILALLMKRPPIGNRSMRVIDAALIYRMRSTIDQDFEGQRVSANGAAFIL